MRSAIYFNDRRLRSRYGNFYKRSTTDQERLVQSGLEYWKAKYESQKHLTLIALTATAGFSALLGGFFGGPGEWTIGELKANIFIAFIFAGFLVSLILASFGAEQARHVLGIVHQIQTEEDIYFLGTRTAQRRRLLGLRKWSLVWSARIFIFSLLILLVFIVLNLAVAKACYDPSPTGGPAQREPSAQCPDVLESFQGLFETRRPEGLFQNPAPETPAPETPNVAEQIRDLGELRDAGLITTADYEATKAELLDRM